MISNALYLAVDDDDEVDAGGWSHSMLSTWTRLPTVLRTPLPRCTKHLRYPQRSISTQWSPSLLPVRRFSTQPIWRNQHDDKKLDRQTPPPHVVLADKLRGKLPTTMRENIYTIPNFLTVSRILACPVLGWSILGGNFYLATSILVYAGASDWVSVYHVYHARVLLRLT